MKIKFYNSGSFRKANNWNRKNKASNGTIIKIREKGNLLGSVFVRKNWILSLVVNPKYRGIGIGRILLNQAEKVIKKNYKVVYLIPMDNEEYLRKWYAKNGYFSSPDSYKYEEEDKASWIMIKPL